MTDPPVFSVDWFSQSIPNFQQYLGGLKGQRVQGLEVGCYEGRSTVWLLENVLTAPGSRLHVVDSFTGNLEHQDSETLMALLPGLRDRFLHNIEPWKDKVILHEGASAWHLRRLYEQLFDGLDFVYVDGSHVAQDVLEDAVLVWPLLKIGGLLIFDDYTWKPYDNPRLMAATGIDAFQSVYLGAKVEARNHQMILRKHRAILLKGIPYKE